MEPTLLNRRVLVARSSGPREGPEALWKASVGILRTGPILQQHSSPKPFIQKEQEDSTTPHLLLKRTNLGNFFLSE